MGSLLRNLSSSSGSKNQGDAERSSSGRESLDGGFGGNSGGTGGSEVLLNVYDLTPMNNYGYWFGVGVFHSGIEVHGMEYGFGAHEHPSSGVFEVEPKRCPGFIYRRSVWLGTTDNSLTKFREFIEQLSNKYHGNTYHLISKNCNHFTNDVCTYLTGKPIPGWVNRLARLGSFCNCLLPESIQVTAIRVPDESALSDGTGSVASDCEESDEENMNHHLLITKQSSDMVLARATHSTIGKSLS